MPSKKKKYNARFPAGRIKKIMQTDEDVGKVAQPVPIIISRTLELFVHSLLTKTMQITSAKNAKTLSPYHMKQCILSESRFDFLKDLVKGLPDVSGPDDDVPTPPLTPAPVSTNSNYSTLTYAQSTVKKEEEGEVSMTNTPKPSTKDIKITVPPTNSTIAFDTQKVSCAPQAPEFQITVPASFQINQPNFYTEVNPVNLSTNSSNTSSSNNPPTSNFTNTANIDEDYDT